MASLRASKRNDKSTILPLALKVLTISQNASAGLFSTFLVVHLASPVSAAFAPSSQAESIASSFMVLGRVMYQDSIGEYIFVWGSLGIHLASGVAKRVVKNLLRQEKKKSVKEMAEMSLESGESGDLRLRVASGERAEVDEEAEFDREKHEDIKEEDTEEPIANSAPLVPLNTHQKTGYILVLPLLAHISLHRLLPSSLSPPLTPFFSYSFVSYSLSSPAAIVSATSYAILVGLATYHGIVGARILLDPIAPRSLKPKRSKKGVMGRSWQGAFAGVVAGVGIGLARLASEGHAVPAFMGNRYLELMKRSKMIR